MSFETCALPPALSLVAVDAYIKPNLCVPEDSHEVEQFAGLAHYRFFFEICVTETLH